MSDNKTQKSIPTSKVKRAAKIVGTSAKVGGNYVKYYTKKAFNKETTKDELHADNAADIYETLSELKGSALKVAQMMSMDEQVLPKAYQDKFAMSQFNAPPLSYPLIVKTFVKYFGKQPDALYDEFEKEAINAASIGQVHVAHLKGKKLAVKVQYPGVADAISSDLKLVKPLAAKLFNMKTADLKMYMDEVESKLIEETNYDLELKSGQDISESFAQFDFLVFPKYYPEFSSERILTMDWLEGNLLNEFIKNEKDQSKRNAIGQYLWDFTLYQMKVLKKVHADPHPGNFIVTHETKLGVIDFGCVKEIPDDFAKNYFLLLHPEIQNNKELLEQVYENMSFFRKEDTEKEKQLLREMYQSVIGLLGKPFHTPSFDFSDKKYFEAIFTMGESFSKDKTFRKLNTARGSRDAIYIMRTFFGLFNLLHQLRANVELNYPLFEAELPKTV